MHLLPHIYICVCVYLNNARVLSYLAGVIKPDVVVAFYPTRYDIEQVSSSITCPVAAFFAENDVLVGARLEDAQNLREKLLNNPKVLQSRCIMRHALKYRGTRIMRLGFVIFSRRIMIFMIIKEPACFN